MSRLTSAATSFSKMQSRRSTVHSTKGMVACSQPLAAAVGNKILSDGGNAADACVAMAAALNVTEPCSTGIGGDVFCLFFDAKTGTVRGLNGSGRAPQELSAEWVLSQGLPTEHGKKGRRLPAESVHCITVPGAPAAWVDTVESFGSGKMDLAALLAPAIALAEDGYPVHEVTALQWQASEELLRTASPNGGETPSMRECHKSDL